MKILYLGHFREGSGWSQAAIDLCLAMDRVGLDVVCRSIKINDRRPDLPIKFLELEDKSTDGVTHCIQHILPHYMEYNSKVKCIAYYVAETTNQRCSSWPIKLQQMDEIWVPNHAMQNTLKDNNLDKPSCVIPHATNISKYQAEYTLDLGTDFKFYSIIDFNKRKNVIALLRAFHSAFWVNEQVSLVLKVNPGNEEQIEDMSRKVKEGLKLHKNISDYKKEIIISKNFNEEEILALHNTCDSYVCTSYNEAWCIPLFDSMGFGNVPISNSVDGPKEYINNSFNGYLVQNQSTPCFNYNTTFGDIYTGYENWYEINIVDLMAKMRGVYELGDLRENISLLSKNTVKKYSYESVGNQIKGALCNQ